MKKINFLFFEVFFLVFFLNVCLVNAQWTTQVSPKGAEILGRMQVVSSTEAWIVCGASGSLIHTTNAGSTWTAVTPFPADVCGNSSDVGLTLSFPNATHGWALKTYGYNNETDDEDGATLYQTINGGVDWTKKDFPKLVPSVVYSAADLVGTWQVHALYVDNPNDGNVFNGWGYGTTIENANGTTTYSVTNSNGQSASQNSTTPPSISSRGKFSIPDTDMEGFMSADKNTVLITQTDGSGGYNLIVWQKVNPSTIYNIADLQGTWKLHQIQNGSSASTIEGTITFDTAGNGSTVANGPSGQFSRDFSVALSPSGLLTSNGTDMNGYLGADKQTIFLTQSSDIGYAFAIMQKVVPNTSYSAADMMGIWQLHGLRAGDSPAWVHAQYKIDAAGHINVSNWKINNETMTNTTSSIALSSTGTITGFGSSTTNGFLSADKSLGLNTLSDGSGAYYLAIYQKDLSVSGDHGMQVQFADDNTGWVSIYNPLYGDFKIYKTTNGGTDWAVINGVTNPVGGFYYFKDALNGWMFGASDKTTGTNTDILHSTDGGMSWTTQVSNAGSPHAISFSDTNHGWIVGYNGLVMHTIDGGAHWTTLTNLGLDANATHKAVFALNNNVCYISSDRFVLKTIDGGSHWTSTETPFQYSIFNVVFWDENNGWISGDYGEIAHYGNDTGIAKQTEQSITISPNPTSDFVTIKGLLGSNHCLLYDVAGQCVFNNPLNDTYKMDIRTLKAGIYFMKLPTVDKNTVFRIIKK